MNNDIKNEIIKTMSGLSKYDQIKMLIDLIEDITAECDEQKHYDPHNDRFNAKLRYVLNTHHTTTLNEMTQHMRNTCGDIITMIYRIFDLMTDNGIYFKNTTKIHIADHYTNCTISGHFVDEDNAIVLNIGFNVDINRSYDYTGKFQLGIKENEEYFVCREAKVYMHGGKFTYDNIVNRFVSDRMLQKDENGYHSKIKNICDITDKFCNYLDGKG